MRRLLLSLTSGRHIKIRSLFKTYTRRDHIMKLNPARKDWVMKHSRGEKLHGKGDAALVGSLSVQQLQDMIANTIKVQYRAPSRDTLIYSKPYTRRIDNLWMPTGYEPPKFQ
ncbi:hypothetical protein L3X38_001779 [Prunus dulcis]|uniref:Uncharacterized protein n=1 Tax=Prunus dulcis TaxID=3755 RepID=A0AAD4ZJC4_PRUDU|nr:hypothetical protein L3X38_001779 [Prunus dulcis]